MNSVEGYKGFVSFVILSGIVLTALVGFRMLAQPTDTTSRASDPNASIFDIKVTNVTDSTVTISWVTQEPTFTSLIYSTNESVCVSSDQNCRSFEDNTPTLSHNVNLSNLEASLLYYTRIKLDNVTYYPVGDPILFQTNQPVVKVTQETKPVQEQPESELISPLAEDDDFSGFSDLSTLPSVQTKTDFENIQSVLSAFDTEDFSGILGTKTNLVEREIAKEFQEAVETNNPRYDFNKDETVTIEDYPLFIEFILNQED